LKEKVLKKERVLEEAIAGNKAALDQVFGASPEMKTTPMRRSLHSARANLLNEFLSVAGDFEAVHHLLEGICLYLSGEGEGEGSNEEKV
jgi:hypothetical protein